MKIDVNLRMADDEGKGNTVAFGTVTLNRRIRFIVQIRKEIRDGGERLKVMFPRQQIKGEWVDLLECEEQVEIEEEVLKAFSFLVIHDIPACIPDIEIKKFNILKLPEGSDVRVQTVALADVSFDGILIRGIQIKYYCGDILINMPQYKGKSGYHDIIYATDQALQNKMKERLLQKYGIESRKRKEELIDLEKRRKEEQMEQAESIK